MDTVTEKRPRVEASDPNQHIIWDWKAEKWIPAKRNEPKTADLSAHTEPGQVPHTLSAV